ncbi:bifunctional tetrahydrofolate synthase/dihydrofolate synthase [Bisbaumannia pacifica]|uniref:Dihydrofolate synthase/folylpolyglutamate synthase n=1 Tax=Bisbaumannia pacifica TaxID=77098 RepID=A0A510XCP2_9GAMM|nr:bifunctional tetrahydrofolate synthase/dihydrofolate synthase [Halomonas pacifica]MBH8578487.1 bifunctional tetrahydrofolate synthase/dihydrofolate synthase [Halomonas pacifica]GEK48467.1 bifunctional folylpolyglutamate synthase/dihydrofolate synthase [Halomonas pacifica]
MSDMPSTLDAWLERLERQHPVSIDLGLERVARVARRLGLDTGPIAERVITVAGTNGKGSTVAMLEALGRAHGLSTASYTSPHLLRYNERLRFDGEEADDATLIAGFAAVEAARLDGEAVSLTYFEAGTLAALWAIARRRPELAILEVGLGGRLDAVNVIDPDVAVVTTVAQDHAAFLGDDLEGIGREKAGILRAGRPAVLGSTDLPASVVEVADGLGAVRHTLGEDYRRELSAEGWAWRGRDAAGAALHLAALPDPGLPLDNAATALQALALAGVTLDAVACRRALAGVTLAGRMQWRGQWCLDVGHNPHAAAYLAARLAERTLAPRARRYALLGMLGDKDAEGVVRALAPVIDGWVCATLEGERARTAAALAEVVRGAGGEVVAELDSPRLAADWLAARLDEADEVLVCGSFFTVADVLAGWQS